MYKLTNSGEQPSHRLVVLVDNDFVLAKHTSADALDNTNLGGLLVLKLSQAEGESSKLLDNLGQERSGSRALQLVGGGCAAMQSSAVAVVLDLAASQTDAHLNTPNLAGFGQTFTSDTLARGKDNLLLRLDLVVVEKPDGGALDEVAVVSLDDLLQHVGDLALCVGLLGGSLGLLLLVAVRDQTGGNHQPEKELVCVVCSQNEISFATSDFSRVTDNDIVANDSAETVDLSTELDFDNFALLECCGGLLGVGLEGRVGSDVGARRDGGAVSNALLDLFALVDLGDFLFQKLVAALTELDNVSIGGNPSYNVSICVLCLEA